MQALKGYILYSPQLQSGDSLKILLIHSDYIEYEAKKKAKGAEEVPEDRMTGKMDEVLVVFTAVERDDSEDDVEIAGGEVLKVAETVGAERIMIYPYAHLSSNLGSPEKALKLLKILEKRLSTSFDGDVGRAPFGWYKAFRISCKGHPLSELSREIKANKKEEMVKGEEKFLILKNDGTEIEVSDAELGNDDFSTMVKKEALHEEARKSEPKYLRLCHKFGIEWEDMSDAGHMHFAPKAALLMDLVSDYSWQVVNDLGIPVMTVKGTNMFNVNEPAVKEHADLFGDRLYFIDTGDKRLILRYAACHQQFAMMRKWNISYKQLPFGAFEVADAYRLEQSGETMLCFRTRRMNMPDLHVICRDEKEAVEWFKRLHERIFEEMEKLGRDYEMLINFSSRKAYEESKEWILELLGKRNKKALLHFYPEGINYYWTINIEYHIKDYNGRMREIGTVQMDVGNAKRFGIRYIDEDGMERYPIILHTAVIGTLERYLYTIFDRAVIEESKGKTGTVPLWMNPEQVRFIPVKEKHRERARELAEYLTKHRIRAGYDDRDLSVGKKVRSAKQDWVGYVIVIGDKEMGTETMNVYVREENRNREITLQALISEIKEKTEGMPYREMYFPKEVSKRVFE